MCLYTDVRALYIRVFFSQYKRVDLYQGHSLVASVQKVKTTLKENADFIGRSYLPNVSNFETI